MLKCGLKEKGKKAKEKQSRKVSRKEMIEMKGSRKGDEKAK